MVRSRSKLSSCLRSSNPEGSKGKYTRAHRSDANPLEGLHQVWKKVKQYSPIYLLLLRMESKVAHF
jgi:hypothetical protein